MTCRCTEGCGNAPECGGQNGLPAWAALPQAVRDAARQSAGQMDVEVETIEAVWRDMREAFAPPGGPS